MRIVWSADILYMKAQRACTARTAAFQRHGVEFPTSGRAIIRRFWTLSEGTSRNLAQSFPAIWLTHSKRCWQTWHIWRVARNVSSWCRNCGNGRNMESIRRRFTATIWVRFNRNNRLQACTCSRFSVRWPLKDPKVFSLYAVHMPYKHRRSPVDSRKDWGVKTGVVGEQRANAFTSFGRRIARGLFFWVKAGRRFAVLWLSLCILYHYSREYTIGRINKVIAIYLCNVYIDVNICIVI